MKKEKIEELKSYIDQLKTIKILKERKEDNKFLSLKSIDFFLNNGNVINREQLLKNGKNGSASIILAITKENNIILVVQPRVFTKRTVGIELPAGYIEDNENPKVSALRELEEETGYKTKNIKEIGQFYQDQGCSKALNHIFIAYDCEKKKEQKLDKDEYIKYFLCTYKEAIELMDMGYINDANSMLALEKSKKYLKRRN